MRHATDPPVSPVRAVPPARPVRRYLVVGLALLVAAGVVAGWWLAGRPVTLVDGPGGRLDCASYVPPRFDATDRPATQAEIEADLRVVAGRFRCIRTYATEGIDNLPAAARAAGLRVLLGAWIGSDARSNRREIERLISLANRNRDVIDALVVGNEVFLRRELTVEKLRALLVEVQARTGLPVTTADIWAFWPQDPALLETVSFMMVHILPYWDDQPVSIDAVLPHVQQVYADMTRKFPGKVIMIGETGWPSAGRPRGALKPGRVNAARYVRGFTAWATANGIRYNLIEAFDQPWKRPNEGTVGGFWGLYDAAGLEKFPLRGPVMEDPRWRTSLGLSLAAGFLVPLAVAVIRRRVPAAAGSAFLGLAGLSAMGAVLWQSAYLQAGNRDWLDWCATLAFAAAGWTVAALVVAALARWLDAPGPAHPHREQLMARRLFGPARFIVLLGAAYVALGLVLAGRHRDFPWPCSPCRPWPYWRSSWRAVRTAAPLRACGKSCSRPGWPSRHRWSSGSRVLAIPAPWPSAGCC